MPNQAFTLIAVVIGLFCVSFILSGCSYPEAIQVDAPVVSEILESQQLSFDERNHHISHELYASLLAVVVDEQHACLRREMLTQERMEAFRSYIQSLASVDLKRLSDNEQKALFINAHNASAILHLSEIIAKFPDAEDSFILEKIDEYDEYDNWDLYIGDSWMTTESLRNGILRPIYKDPTVFFVLSDGTTRFSPFANYPMSGRGIRLQLSTAARRILEDPRYVRVIDEEEILLSYLFFDAEGDITDIRNKPRARSLREWLLSYGNDRMRLALEGERGAIVGRLYKKRTLLLCQ